jgi:hypothetical protein
MPRFIVERTFPNALWIPATDHGVQTLLAVAGRNVDLNVTWVHSYVCDDRMRTLCVHDGPEWESMRKAAERNALPVDQITRVSVLDPLFLSLGRVVHTFVQHARAGALWFAPWASVVLISSVLAYCFDQALINCCSHNDSRGAALLTRSIEVSTPRDSWHDGTLFTSSPGHAVDNHGPDYDRCWRPEMRSTTCGEF